MTAVFPVFDHSPTIYKVWASPVFWGPEIVMKENVCGSAHFKTFKVVSESKAKSPFLFKVQLGENGDIYQFSGPGKKEIRIPESCFHIRLSAKSLTIGQIIRCEVN